MFDLAAGRTFDQPVRLPLSQVNSWIADRYNSLPSLLALACANHHNVVEASLYPQASGHQCCVLILSQEIETWVTALGHYDNNEFEESLKTFDNISDTSKILFNCGVIHATLGEHDKAVSGFKDKTLGRMF